MRRYALTILCCSAAGAAIMLALNAFSLPFWIYPAGLMSFLLIASRLTRRRVVLAEGKVMQARSPAASWERNHPVVASAVIAGLTGSVVFVFLYANAPHASLTSLLGVGLGFGLLLGLGTFGAIATQRRFS